MSSLPIDAEVIKKAGCLSTGLNVLSGLRLDRFCFQSNSKVQGGFMSNEVKIGGKSFVIDNTKASFGQVTPDERKEQHQEHTTSDTLVSVLRPEPRPQAPIRTSSVAPEDIVHSRIAFFEGLVSGRFGIFGMFAMWLFGGVPAFFVAREIWFLCINHLPSFSEEPGRFLMLMLGLVVGEALPLCAILVLAINTLAAFGPGKSSRTGLTR